MQPIVDHRRVARRGPLGDGGDRVTRTGIGVTYDHSPLVRAPRVGSNANFAAGHAPTGLWRALLELRPLAALPDPFLDGVDGFALDAVVAVYESASQRSPTEMPPSIAMNSVP